MQGRVLSVFRELRAHAPFTAFGALTGIALMLAFRNTGHETAHRLFQVFHPAHVALSALATASLFKARRGTRQMASIIVIGYFGAIGVATLSDCVLPFFGETLLGVAVPVHSHGHGEDHAHETNGTDHSHAEHEHDTSAGVADHNHAEADHDAGHAHGEAQETAGHDDSEHTGPHIHLGFIEDWYIVNPAAFLGILLAFVLPHTRFSHLGHVLVSTWASSFHMLMNTQATLTPLLLGGAFVVLFIAVWLPCCISDIVFPSLFLSDAEQSELSGCCGHH